jgi:acetoin utilization protein AcuB
MKAMPQIHVYMTSLPHTIGRDIPISEALSMMREHRIRHIPVMDAGKLVGVITDRDVKLAASFKGGETLTVEEAMTPDPYTVAPETPANYVVSHVAEHRLGCAIVRQANGKVVGIFTATDGLRVLSEMLASGYRAAG